MALFQVKSTSDVSLEELEQATRALGSRIPLQIDPRQASFKSFEAPSWVHFFQEPRFWVEALVGGLAVDLVKAAAKEAWRHRGTVQIVAREGADLAVKEFVDCLAILRQNLGADTALRIGFPTPDDWFGTLLMLEGDEPSILAVQVALFLAHAPALDRFLDEHGSSVATGIFLSLADNGDMIVEWQDKAKLGRHRQILVLPDVA